jgi:hypothetical protein
VTGAAEGVVCPATRVKLFAGYGESFGDQDLFLAGDRQENEHPQSDHQSEIFLPHGPSVPGRVASVPSLAARREGARIEKLAEAGF